MTGTTNARIHTLENEVAALKHEIELIKEELRKLTSSPLRTGRQRD